MRIHKSIVKLLILLLVMTTFIAPSGPGVKASSPADAAALEVQSNVEPEEQALSPETVTSATYDPPVTLLWQVGNQNNSSSEFTGYNNSNVYSSV
ncbi:hypothetical protein D3C79_1018020 [compost metagenome]